ncbi:MAG: DUF4058 family protein [Fimbriiglobus sp.]|nr:DUF4058 family protein [Fimbriiglobus sp.]
MPSPFPGMDPFLEGPAVWPSFHRHLVAAVYQMLLPGLVDRYRARVVPRNYTSELVLFTSVSRENHAEEFIEIRSRNDGRLVTLVELVSVGNRTTAAGRAVYLATRADAQAERAGVVEIDLVTQGKPPVDLDRSALPPFDHTVCVTRGCTPDRHEIYSCSLRKRLPKFKLPLAADDRDTVLDLQLAVVRAYDTGRFDTQLDYSKPLPPDVKLKDDDRLWAIQTANPPKKH